MTVLARRKKSENEIFTRTYCASETKRAHLVVYHKNSRDLWSGQGFKP
jgi:hypothetical protein